MMKTETNSTEETKQVTLAELYGAVRKVSSEVTHLERRVIRVPRPERAELSERVAVIAFQKQALRRDFGQLVNSGDRSDESFEEVRSLAKHLEIQSRSLLQEAEELTKGSRAEPRGAGQGPQKFLETVRRRMRWTVGSEAQLWAPRWRKTFEKPASFSR